MPGVHLAELCLTLSYLEMCIVIMHVFCYLSVCLSSNSMDSCRYSNLNITYILMFQKTGKWLKRKCFPKISFTAN